MRLLRRRRKERSKYNRRPAALPRVFLHTILPTKSGTPASQAPQEFQNIYPIPTTTVFISSTAKSGGLHIVRPPVSAKIQLRKNSLLSSQNALYPGTPARSAGGSPFSFWRETSPRIQLHPEGRGTRTAIPLITTLNSLSFLHLGSDGSAFPRQSVFPYKKKGKSIEVCSRRRFCQSNPASSNVISIVSGSVWDT